MEWHGFQDWCQSIDRLLYRDQVVDLRDQVGIPLIGYGYDPSTPRFDLFDPGDDLRVDRITGRDDDDGHILIEQCDRPMLKLGRGVALRSEGHTSELQSRGYLVCRLLLENKISY